MWEIEIKRQSGKLELRLPLHELIAKERTTNGLMLLPIEYEHALAIGNLPLHHKDPFDRLLLAQAIVVDLPLLSVDSKLSQYDVRLIG